MSILHHDLDGWVVACDLCHHTVFTAYLPYYRTQRDAQGREHHVCNSCSKRATWCAACQRYQGNSERCQRLCAACGQQFWTRASYRSRWCGRCLLALTPQPPGSAGG